VVIAGLLAAAVVGAAASARGDGGGDAPPPSSLQARVARDFARSGLAHLKAGRIQEATEDLTAALSFDPTLEEAREALERVRNGLAFEAARPEPEPEPTAVEPTAEPDVEGVVPVPEPDTEAVVRLKGTCALGQRLLARGQYDEAADTFRGVLADAEALAARADVSDVQAQAQSGLGLALEGLRAREPADAEPTDADPRLARDAEYEQAMQQALREVGRMMRPQTEIMAKGDLPRKLTELVRNKEELTTDTIGGAAATSDDDTKLIRAQLLKRVSVGFQDQSFGDAVEYVRVASGANILIDPTVLPTTRPVTLAVNDMELRHVLDWMLKFQQLDYRIRNGAIFISNAAGLADRPVTILHDISDLIVRVRDFDGSNLQVERVPGYERSPYDMGIQEARDDTEQLDRTREGEDWSRFIRENVAPTTWAGEGGVALNTIAYRNGKLVVTHTPEVQEKIIELLSSFRKARAIQVAILARFLEINEHFLEDLGVQWSGLGEDGNLGIYRDPSHGSARFGAGTDLDSGVALGTTAFNEVGGLVLEGGVMRRWQVHAMLSAVRKNRKGNILTAPRVTCFNTQRAFMTVSTIQNFVRTYDSDDNPIIGQVNDGIVLEVQPFVSADRKYITLELIPQVNTVGAFDTFDFRQQQGDDDDDTAVETFAQVQLPEVTTRQVKTTVSVPDGGTLMIGGLARATETEGEAVVPFLGELPLIKHLFRSSRALESRNSLIVLVTAHIIQQEED